MANVCDYSVISDSSFDLDSKTALVTFTKTLEGTPVSGEGAMLMWKECRLGDAGSVNYDLSINGTSVGNFAASVKDNHSVHEVFDTSVLGNDKDIVITFTRTSPGSIKLSDVVLMFRQVA